MPRILDWATILPKLRYWTHKKTTEVSYRSRAPRVYRRIVSFMVASPYLARLSPVIWSSRAERFRVENSAISREMDPHHKAHPIATCDVQIRLSGVIYRYRLSQAVPCIVHMRKHVFPRGASTTIGERYTRLVSYHVCRCICSWSCHAGHRFMPESYSLWPWMV